MFMVYFLMGVLFTYVAFENASETIWNPLTIILLLIAALDFFIAFVRLWQQGNKSKINNEKRISISYDWMILFHWKNVAKIHIQHTFTQLFMNPDDTPRPNF